MCNIYSVMNVSILELSSVYEEKITMHTKWVVHYKKMGVHECLKYLLYEAAYKDNNIKCLELSVSGILHILSVEYRYLLLGVW